MKHTLALTLALFLTTFWAIPLSAAMTGGDFEIYADGFDYIDSQVSEGGAFSLFDTGGESFATSTAGGSFILNGGFEYLEKGVISLALSASTLSLGQTSLSTVTTGSVSATVSTDSHTGYSLSISENGSLCSPSVSNCNYSFGDVSDGAVTAGFSEYGIRTAGSHGQQNNSDVAITGSGPVVASFEGPIESGQTDVTFKAAISIDAIGGGYSHLVSFTVTVRP